MLLATLVIYLDRTFKEEQNDINFRIKIILLSWCKFLFYLPSQ